MSAHAQFVSIENSMKDGHRAMEISATGKVLMAGSNSSVVLIDKSGFIQNIAPKTDSVMEYRSAEIINDSTFLIANAGSPAYVFKTSDAGKTWSLVYQNNHPSVFIDAMVGITNKHLMLYGDQIDGAFLSLESFDAGDTWQEITSFPKPKNKTDAGFAASDAGMIVQKDTIFAAISGEENNYVLMSPNAGKTWDFIKTKMQNGVGAGTFAMAYINGKLVLIGGAYAEYDNSKGNISIIDVVGRQNIEVGKAPIGYRSGIACHNNVCICTGTTGTDISFDAGVNWKQVSDVRYFTVKFKGDRFYLSGPKGRYAQYKL